MRLFIFIPYIKKIIEISFTYSTFCHYHRHIWEFWASPYSQISFTLQVCKVKLTHEENQMLPRRLLRSIIVVSVLLTKVFRIWNPGNPAIEICIILIEHNPWFVNNGRMHYLICVEHYFLAHTVQMFQFRQSFVLFHP